MKKIKLRYRYVGQSNYHEREITHMWCFGGEITFQDRTTDDPPLVLEDVDYWTLLINRTEEVDAANKTSTEDPGRFKGKVREDQGSDTE